MDLSKLDGDVHLVMSIGRAYTLDELQQAVCDMRHRRATLYPFWSLQRIFVRREYPSKRDVYKVLESYVGDGWTLARLRPDPSAKESLFGGCYPTKEYTLTQEGLQRLLVLTSLQRETAASPPIDISNCFV
jgi:hypothetical protein